MPCTSLPQMPTAFTAMSTSSAAGGTFDARGLKPAQGTETGSWNGQCLRTQRGEQARGVATEDLKSI
jgi:hypothetical protein